MTRLRELDSPLQGHPDRMRCLFVDVSTGALGQGLSVALGRAEARRAVGRGGHVYCVLGDGECQEGQIWEAAMYAGAKKVSNLVVVIDHNGMQGDGAVRDTNDLGSVGDKFGSFGWQVHEIDGHSHPEIDHAVRACKNTATGPSVIVAHTIKGHLGPGRSLLGGAHSGSLTADELHDALDYLAVAS